MISLDNLLNTTVGISIILKTFLPSSSNVSHQLAIVLGKLCPIWFRKCHTVHVVFKFKTLFISLFQCSNMSSLFWTPLIFRMYYVWLIRVRSISLNDVVFLGMNPKENLFVHPTGTYLGLMKFLLDDSSNSLCLGITQSLDLISSMLSSSPIS